MINIKNIVAITLLGSSTLLFSGCISTAETFDHGHSHMGTINHDNREYFSSSYAYDTYRPYYFLNGRYYYGGHYSNGFYYYKGRRFSRGHYYRHGYRYHHGKRYKATRGRYGYHVSRKPHHHDRHLFKKHRPYATKKQHVHAGHPRDNGYNGERYSSKHIHHVRRTW